ncbi:hypothetical protein VAR608DRAFT_3302 [Variovorax sp. HW608]|uniref:alpha/beta hydrolase n=1 Tax=Variovorax sp. HW608 TaxID=1034889 RepID=UPI00081FE200|nr:alpha/beta hydrolase [Variovorax sp. HW608]SCK36172.1 hypothetical protein VAR608DRAFT_3302 [Variovorax sp. HW608]
MNTSKLIAAAALSILAAAGAQAETYDGVHAPVSANSRAEVQAQGVVAARSENAYGDAASSRVEPALTASADRQAVRTTAVATAHSANQNLKREAFVNSVVPSQFKLETTKQAGL